MQYTEANELLTYRGKPVDHKVLHDMKSTELDGDGLGNITVSYHGTPVVTFHSDDTVTLRSGGWFTNTTRDRIQHFTGLLVGGNPWTIVLRVRNPAYDHTNNEPYSLIVFDLPFREGMRLNPKTGEILEAGQMIEFVDHNKAVEKAAKKLAKAMTPDFVREALARDDYPLSDETPISEDGEDNTAARAAFEKALFDGNLTDDFIRYAYRINYNGYNPIYGGSDPMKNYFYDERGMRSGREPEHYAERIRREVIAAIRIYLIVGPVHLRKNVGIPRKIA
jgi:hypothetical protein